MVVSELLLAIPPFVGRVIKTVVHEVREQSTLLSKLKQLTNESSEILLCYSEMGAVSETDASLEKKIAELVSILKQECLSISQIKHCLSNNLFGILRSVVKGRQISRRLRERQEKLESGMSKLSALVLRRIHMRLFDSNTTRLKLCAFEAVDEQATEETSSHFDVIPSFQVVSNILETIGERADLREGLMDQLVHLAEDNNAIVRGILECDGLRVIVGVLKSTKRPTIAAKCVDLLSRMLPFLPEESQRETVLIAALDYMKRHVDRPLEVMAIVRHLCTPSDETFTVTRASFLVLQHDGVQAVLDFASHHMAQPTVQSQGLFLIALLSKSNTNIRIQVGMDNGLEGIRKAMLSFPESAVVQRSACASLYHVCREVDANCRQAVEMDLHVNVLSALERHLYCEITYRFGMLFLFQAFCSFSNTMTGCPPQRWWNVLLRSFQNAACLKLRNKDSDISSEILGKHAKLLVDTAVIDSDAIGVSRISFEEIQSILGHLNNEEGADFEKEMQVLLGKLEC